MNRFASTSKAEIQDDLKSATPKATIMKRNWAIKLFTNWHANWKVRLNDDHLKVYKDVNEFDKSDLDYCLKYFFADVRREDGNKYPPATLKQIAALLQNYFINEMRWNFSFFIDGEFKESRDVLDSQMKKSAKEGNVAVKRKAAVISLSVEDEMWDKQILGSSNPRQLQNTLIYSLGLHLSLRASKEHRDLEFGPNSQLELKSEKELEFIEYTERVSKNKTFGLKHCIIEPKHTRIYQNLVEPNKCVVGLYKKFISKRPKNATTTAFYLAVRDNFQECGEWYKNCPLGVHSIENATRKLIDQLDTIEDKQHYTNSSLRRTSKNRLICGGISAEVAQKKTGRISSVADAAYIDESLYEQEMSSAIYGFNNATVNYNRKDTQNNSFPAPIYNNCSVTNNYYYH